MSFNTFSSYLKPDPWLRLFVDVTARLLIAGAIGIALTMSVSALPRLALSLCCLWLGSVELTRLHRGFEACTAIRLTSDGNVGIDPGDGNWVTADLESGSIVLRRLAWLRLRTANGRLITELLRGDARQCRDWRRLQVIWRHFGASD